jgi:hypothetical protein
MYDAADLASQCYFFDNSEDEVRLFAQFRLSGNEKIWEIDNSKGIPDWFVKYYVAKIK